MSDKRNLKIASASVLAVLLIAMILPTAESGRIVAAVLLLPAAVLFPIFFKKRDILSINKKQILLLVSTVAVLFVLIQYLTGIEFGYYKNLYFLNLGYLIPLVVIIVSTEIIRLVTRALNDKLANVLCYFALILADALFFGNIHYVDSFNRFMDFVALTLFPSVITNLVFHYLSKRYGMYPNLVYRGVTTLYAYLIPVIPAIPDSLLAFAKLFVPLFMFFFIDALYEKRRRYALKKKSKLSPIITALAIIILAGFVMLISNQFKYGALVIATESMTGELNKGDAIVFEAYDGQTIEKGRVIVFEKNDSTVVHRVIDIQRKNGIVQYFTKGDANEDPDAGFLTQENIVGLVDFKVPAVGYPTLWLRSLFDR